MIVLQGKERTGRQTEVAESGLEREKSRRDKLNSLSLSCFFMLVRS